MGGNLHWLDFEHFRLISVKLDLMIDTNIFYIFKTCSNHFYFHSRSQFYEKAQTSAFILSPIFRWIWIKLSPLLGPCLLLPLLHSLCTDRLDGLVVRCPPPERKIPGSNPVCAGIFSGSSHTRDLNIGTPVATLPGAWRYRVSIGTGRPGVSIL